MDGRRRTRPPASAFPSWDRIRRELTSPILQPLLVAVGVMITLHLLEAGGLVDTTAGVIGFSLGAERSLAELLGHVIAASIIVGLLDLAGRPGGDRRLYVLAGSFGLVLVDDVVMLREQVGSALVSLVKIDTIGGLPTDEAGQLACGVAVGVVALAVGARRGPTAPPASRFITAWVSALMVAFAGLSVGFEVVRRGIGPQPSVLEEARIVTEHGVVLVVMALIASFVFARVREDDALEADDGLLIVVDDLVIDLRADESEPLDSIARF